MQLQMDGGVAVVTGGASGIGLACARQYLREGCRVAIWDLSPELETVASQLRDEFSQGQASTRAVDVLPIYVDITNYDAVREAATATEVKLGSIDYVAHAAAIGSGKFGYPFTNLQPSDWRRVLEVNIMGTTHVAHAVAPGMVERQRGSIVLIASVAAQIGSPTDPPYSASKAANVNFAQCMAKDLAKHGVRVNVVSPGMVQTPLNRSVWQAWHDRQPPEQRRTYDEWAGDKVRVVAPLGRWQMVEDIADMVVFLSSERARQVTGQCVNVDGGQVMHS